MKNSSHKSVLFAMHKSAFSLIEMLMALLVASLLMAALAPVMIKKGKEGVSLTGEVNAPKLKKHEINYNDVNCSTLNTANNTCEGQFTVPSGYNGSLYLSLIGGGGGGASAPVSGSKEFTAAGNFTFVVPVGVYEIETTVVSGGAGGGSGNFTFDTPAIQDFIGNNADTNQDRTWTIPAALKNKYAIIEACAAGGGGGGAGGTNIGGADLRGGGGGAGEYDKIAQLIPSAASLHARIGGGGSTGSIRWGNYTEDQGGPCGGNGGGAYWANAYCSPNLAGAAGSLNVRPSVCNTTSASGGTASGGPISIAGTAQQNGGSGGTYCGGGGGAGTFDGGAGNSVGGKYRYPGGGGGGGAATVISINSNFSSPYLNLVGGGGGSSGALGDVPPASIIATTPIAGGGGGGGGGPATGNKGRGASLVQGIYWGRTGYSGNGNDGDSLSANGLTVSTPWVNNCNGGNQNRAGFPGAARITYFDYNKGGNSGGAGKTLVNQRVKVTPGETLTITVGDGGTGGNAPYINSSGTIINSTSAAYGLKSVLYRGTTAGTVLLNTGDSNPSTVASSDTTGKQGQPALLTELQPLCTPGTGPTAGNNSAAAIGYGGCGGGGGGALGNGSKGAPGYAKITWNPDKLGNGGGGSSANYINKYKLEAKSGNIIKYQIAAGGKGGSINGTTPLVGSYGSDTIFGTGTGETAYKLTAGGGYGGLSASYSTALNKTINGTGSQKANICKLGATNLLICLNSELGQDGTDIQGGNGAISKYGVGGQGSNVGDGENAPTENPGAGGGGAKVKNIGLTTDPSTNTTKGGNGAPGRILIEWYE